MRLISKSLITLAAALSLTACSQEKSEDAAAAATDPAEPAASAADASSTHQAGPDIGGIVAPGAAFTYAYAFTLPADSISGVQQQHAAACERLGAGRCRVTGMRYEQTEADQIEAGIDFLLAPDLAYRFGSEGIAAVERADGKLENATVDGENVGDAITLSQQDSAVAASEITRLEGRLKAKGLTSAERVELTRRIESLRGEQRDQASDRRSKEAALASTPVRFSYSTPSLLSGGNTFGKAAAASWGSLESALAFALLLAGVALPWIGLIALLVLGWRWIKRQGQSAHPSPVEPTPTP
jgi:hypothetical protein